MQQSTRMFEIAGGALACAAGLVLVAIGASGPVGRALRKHRELAAIARGEVPAGATTATTAADSATSTKAVSSSGDAESTSSPLIAMDHPEWMETPKAMHSRRTVAHPARHSREEVVSSEDRSTAPPPSRRTARRTNLDYEEISDASEAVVAAPAQNPTITLKVVNGGVPAEAATTIVGERSPATDIVTRNEHQRLLDRLEMLQQRLESLTMHQQTAQQIQDLDRSVQGLGNQHMIQRLQDQIERLQDQLQTLRQGGTVHGYRGSIPASESASPHGNTKTHCATPGHEAPRQPATESSQSGFFEPMEPASVSRPTHALTRMTDETPLRLPGVLDQSPQDSGSELEIPPSPAPLGRPDRQQGSGWTSAQRGQSPQIALNAFAEPSDTDAPPAAENRESNPSGSAPTVNPSMPKGPILGQAPTLENKTEKRTPESAPAAEGECTLVAGKSGKVTLNCRQANVVDVLQRLGELAARPLIIAPEVTGTVTAQLKDVPVDRAVELVAKAAGVQVQRDRESTVVSMPTGTTSPTPAIASPKLETRLIRPKHLATKDLYRQLEPLLTPEVGRITVTPAPAANQTEALLIQDTAETLAAIDVLIAEIDVPPPQVSLSAAVVLVRLPNGATGPQLMVPQYGVFPGTAVSPEVLRNPGAVAQIPVGKPAQDANGLTYGFLSGSAEDWIESMKKWAEPKVLSTPRLSVTADQTAEFTVASRPVEAAPGTTPNNAAPQPLRKGLKLALRPMLTADGLIRVDLRPESEVPALDPQTGSAAPDQPLSVTSVLVRDGATIALAGLTVEQLVEEWQTVEVKGRFPFGKARENVLTTRTDRQDVIVLITPRIVKPVTRPSGQPSGPASSDLVQELYDESVAPTSVPRSVPNRVPVRPASKPNQPKQKVQPRVTNGPGRPVAPSPEAAPPRPLPSDRVTPVSGEPSDLSDYPRPPQETPPLLIPPSPSGTAGAPQILNPVPNAASTPAWGGAAAAQNLAPQPLAPSAIPNVPPPFSTQTLYFNEATGRWSTQEPNFNQPPYFTDPYQMHPTTPRASRWSWPSWKLGRRVRADQPPQPTLPTSTGEPYSWTSRDDFSHTTSPTPTPTPIAPR